MKRFSIITSMLLVAFVMSAPIAVAEVPQMINYQGRLTDGQGDPVTATVYMIFTIYDQASGGTAWWGDTLASVQVTDGLFNVILGGSGGPIDDSVFSDPDRYLGIAVNGDPEIVPRTRLVSVGYSHRVNTVDGATGGVISGKVTMGSGNTNNTYYQIVAGNSNIADGQAASVLSGEQNSALGSFSVVAGGGAEDEDRGNVASGDNSCVSGGMANSASGFGSSVGGGSNNKAHGDYSVVAGGGGSAAEDSNSASGENSCVGGGENNTASGRYSSVGGGRNNQATGDYSVIAGGGHSSTTNTASGDYSSIGGGFANSAIGSMSTVGGGRDNVASGTFSCVAGGSYCQATGESSFAAGRYSNANAYNSLALGHNNTASGDYSTVSGGSTNTASNTSSSVCGGTDNEASGQYSCIPGGSGNIASGEYSLAAGINCGAYGSTSWALGSYAIASHDRSFVWSSNDVLGASSDRDNQFKVDADGGVKFEVNNGVTFDFRYVLGMPSKALTCSNGAYLTHGGVWTDDTKRDRMENFTDIDRAELLDKIATLPISRWNHMGEGEITHISPMAEDFHDAFAVGGDEGIAAMDQAGIALAAIQELHRKNTELESEVVELKALVKQLLEER
jgi:hypothetical protein